MNHTKADHTNGKCRSFEYQPRTKEQWQKRSDKYEQEKALLLQKQPTAVPTRKNKSQWAKPSRALQDNFVTAVCMDSEAAPVIIRQVPANLIDNDVHRTIFDRAVSYFDKYGTVPGEGHLFDIVEKELASSKAEFYRDVLVDIHQLAKSINRDFVLDQLQEFVRQQSLIQSITIAAEEVQRGNANAAEAEYRRYLERAGNPHSGGLLGLDGAVHTYREFRTIQYPPTVSVLHPVLVLPGITQINGPRGHGKTEVALYMSVGIAGGIAVFGWNCPKALRVLYVDAELPGWEMQQRLEGVVADLRPRHKKIRDNLTILSISDDSLTTPINVADPAQTDELVEYFTQYDVVILDSIMMLTSGMDFNDAKDWETINSLCKRCRNKGTSTVRLHHLGKDRKKGGLGSVGQDTPLNFIMNVEQEEPKTFHGNPTIHITKTKMRNFASNAFKPVDLELVSGKDGQMTIQHKLAHKNKTEEMMPEIIELMRQGKWKDVNQTKFADKYDVHKSRVSRAAKTAKEKLRQEAEEQSLIK